MTGSKAEADPFDFGSIDEFATVLAQWRHDGAWWSPHQWKKGHRLTSEWQSAGMIAVDIDCHEGKSKRVLTTDELRRMRSAWEAGAVSGHLLHRTPHGFRVAALLAEECRDREVWTKAARGLCMTLDAEIAALGIPGLAVDRGPTLDLARLFWTPNASINGEVRASRIFTSADRPPYSATTLAKAGGGYRTSSGGTKPAGGVSRAPAGKWREARDRWVRDHPVQAGSDRACALCGHKGCVNALPGDPSRLWCWSTSHEQDSGGKGTARIDATTGEIRGWIFDTLDAAAAARGVTTTRVLIDDGYLSEEHAGTDDSGRQVVEYHGEHKTEHGIHVREIGDWATEVLSLAREGDGCEVFRRGDALMQPMSDSLIPLNPTSAISLIARYVANERHIRTGGKKEPEFHTIPVGFRRPDGKMLIEHGVQDGEVPEVRAISTHPVFHMNGHGIEIANAGYNEGSRVYVTPTDDVQRMKPQWPGGEIDPDGPKVRLHHEIRELVEDFPFQSNADLHNWVAFAFTMLMRPVLPIVPMFYVGASLPGTGKSLLVSDVTSMLITGTPVPAMQVARDEEETRKRVEAAVLTGQPLVLFDNVPTDQLVGSATLAQMLTSEKAAMRVLGSTNHTTMDQSTTFVMTGNNVTFSEELSTRAVLIRLVPLDAAPTERTEFKHPRIREWIEERRPVLLPKMLGAVQAYIDAGMPVPKRVPMFRMAEWRFTVCGLCEWLGFDEVLGNRATMQEEHGESFGVALSRLLTAWNEHNGLLPLSARDLFRDVVIPSGAFDRELLTVPESKQEQHFRMAILRRARRQPISTAKGPMEIVSRRHSAAGRKQRMISVTPYQPQVVG